MLAIVWHSRTGAAEALAKAAHDGAEGQARRIAASDISPEVLLAASGYLFVCPENLATMSGAMKEMFDRCYYALLGQVAGRPYATIIAAGSDGSGAQAQIDDFDGCVGSGIGIELLVASVKCLDDLYDRGSRDRLTSSDFR